MSQLLSQDGSDEAQATPETLNEEYFPGRNTERKAAAPLNLLSEVTAASGFPHSTYFQGRRNVAPRTAGRSGRLTRSTP
jgi:hypothetical protein